MCRMEPHRPERRGPNPPRSERMVISYGSTMTSAADTITIRFRGVRGSHPMPGPTTLKYGGNTSCQEIRVGGRLLIFDAGTGVISLGLDLMQAGGPKEMAVFFSHHHHDHIGGLLYFKPAYRPDTTMHIYGPADSPDCDILQALERVSCPTAHPVQFTRMGMNYTTQVVTTGDAVVWRRGAAAPRMLEQGETPENGDVVVRVLKNSLHPLEGVLNFRVEYKGKAYVYATDVEGNEKEGDEELAAFARGADMLAHDGQYSSEEYNAFRKGWGHSTLAMAIKTARMAEVKRLAIVHHDPGSADDQLDAMEREGKKEFPNLFFAREGQEVAL